MQIEKLSDNWLFERHSKQTIREWLKQLHYFYFIMPEGRRGRRPPLPATNVAQVTHVESTEGAPSTASDAEHTEAPGKGVVY